MNRFAARNRENRISIKQNGAYINTYHSNLPNESRLFQI